MLMNIARKSYGFTLIELAIVLVIIGVLGGSFISTLSSRIDTTRRADAVKEMEVIKQALYGYAMTQGGNLHFPCPDCRNYGCAGLGANIPNDGKEDRANTGACRANGFPGNIPWVTLGLGSGDPWHNRYSYWVSTAVADDNIAPGFDLGTPMSATAATIRTRIGTTPHDVSNNAVAIIMSQGKNGYGVVSIQNKTQGAPPAGNVDEADNLDDDGVFYSRAPSDVGASTAGGEFDDIVVWISEYELKAKMVEAGVLPP